MVIVCNTRFLDTIFKVFYLNPYPILFQNSGVFMPEIIFKKKKYELGGVLITKTDPYIYILRPATLQIIIYLTGGGTKLDTSSPKKSLIPPKIEAKKV